MMSHSVRLSVLAGAFATLFLAACSSSPNNSGNDAASNPGNDGAASGNDASGSGNDAASTGNEASTSTDAATDAGTTEAATQDATPEAGGNGVNVTLFVESGDSTAPYQVNIWGTDFGTISAGQRQQPRRLVPGTNQQVVIRWGTEFSMNIMRTDALLQDQSTRPTDIECSPSSVGLSCSDTSGLVRDN